MIRPWANSATRRLHEEGRSRKFRGLDLEAALELLATLDAATSLQDLSPVEERGPAQVEGRTKKPVGDVGQRPLAHLLPVRAR
jgi:proteic killer suppression protein